MVELVTGLVKVVELLFGWVIVVDLMGSVVFDMIEVVGLIGAVVVVRSELLLSWAAAPAARAMRAKTGVMKRIVAF